MRLWAGCDVGSTTGKAVILDESKVLAGAIVESTLDPEKTARQALDRAAADMDIAPAGVEFVRLVGTGYGRLQIPFADENVSEITCHAVGAHHLDPKIRTVVDIGGQDLKAIALNDDGTVMEFAMNDKCAAGTGRFFESMARTFQLSLEQFSDLSLTSTKPVSITAQCSVFAESEVVSLVAQKKAPADIAAGAQLAVVRRVISMARRVGIRPDFTISGGCAKNRGLMQLLGQRLKMKVARLDFDPQLLGALGAALLARRKSA
ncbi:MAG TPA: acyl-CoA dehydratase activase [Myxococcota bacterium]|nr:acyl-CoA dehydratase activase [Myxococcota bacterium]